jgi:tetratricopeptide (TPR) repeat protein
LLNRVAGILCVWVLLAGVTAAGAEDLPGPYRFACDLMEKGHWEQAIEEFRRFCFFHPEDPLVPKASLAVGLCYEQGGRFPEAIETYRRVAARYPDDPAGREALYRVGETSYRAESFEDARIALERFVTERPEDPWSWKARYRGAWASLHEHAFVNARDEFSSLALQDNPYKSPAQRMTEGIEEIKDLPHRSPALAGLMSGLLPGSGHLYAGDLKDGLLAFLVTGALIAGSVEAWDQEVYGVAGLVSVAALTFYLGNIYGAVNSAYLANQERLEAHLRDYATSYEWWEEAE